MAETGHAPEQASHADAHAHDWKAHERHYIKVWTILSGLLVVSVAGPFLGIKVVTLITAFGIALVKAYLVVKNFMHLNLEPKFVAYLCATALAFMALLFFFVAPDIMKHHGNNWENVSAAAVATPHVEGEGHAFNAQETFTNVCGACHGAQGRGDGPAGAALNPHPANFNDAAFWTTRDRASVVRVITSGGPSVGKSPLMAAFGTSYTAAQINELADIVLGFRPEAAPEQQAAAEDAGVAPIAEVIDAGPAIEVQPEQGEPPSPAAAATAQISEGESRRRAQFIRSRVLSALR